MLTTASARAWLEAFVLAIDEQHQALDDLDAAIGDGDHGSNLRRGVVAMRRQLAGATVSSPADVLRVGGEALTSAVGGASGVLYGTLLMRVADACGQSLVVDAETLVRGLREGLAGVRTRGGATRGDKTMVDVLEPAFDAMDAELASGAPLAAALHHAAITATVARDATAELVARTGRAQYWGERSRGHVDAGAASATLLIEALAGAMGEPLTPSGVASRSPAARQAPARRVGLVLVSHSVTLAEAARDLALHMVSGEPAPVTIAAGRADGGTGTNATRVAAAISEASQGRGVVVLTDLGSAVLASDMALDLISGRIDVRVVPAPFVEGLIAALVRASAGDDLDTVAREASAALAPKQALAPHADGSAVIGSAVIDAGATADRGRSPSIHEVRGVATVRNQGGLHARPAAELAALASRFDANVRLAVDGKPEAAANSMLSISMLAASAGTLIRISASGPEAHDAVVAISALIESGFGESVVGSDGPAAQPIETAPHHDGALGVSPGRVVGPVALFVHRIDEPSATAILAPPARRAAATIVSEALQRTADDYRERAVEVDGSRHDLLIATAAIAADPALSARTADAIRERGLTPERAVWEAIGDLVDNYRAAGGELADRVTDLIDVRDRVIARLTGSEPPGLPERDTPFVLVADDLAPADTVTLDPQTCLALVTEQGGPTSHTAIIARELGVPAIVGAAGATAIVDGTLVLVDGATGELIVHPDHSVQATATGVLTLPPFAGPGQTSDGYRVVLSANVGAPREIARAVERGAEGVGLFRTEFCFLDRAQEPSVAEQVVAYRELFAAFPGQRVIVRTLDAGSDKPLPFLTPLHEPNPVLGLRGVRTALRDPLVLERQLRAIAEAASAETADVAVMAPMIATLAETEAFAARARAAGISSVGVMLETPAAAMTAIELCGAVDFLSVGTNDLSQYTMAADRQSAALAELADPWQPALLRMIRLVGEAATATATPMGLCGEAAADPDFAAVLVGLGASSLSMVARAIPLVGERLASVSRAQCQQAAAAACAASNPEAARHAARAVLSRASGQ